MIEGKKRYGYTDPFCKHGPEYFKLKEMYEFVEYKVLVNKTNNLVFKTKTFINVHPLFFKDAVNLLFNVLANVGCKKAYISIHYVNLGYKEKYYNHKRLLYKKCFWEQMFSEGTDILFSFLTPDDWKEYWQKNGKNSTFRKIFIVIDTQDHGLINNCFRLRMVEAIEACHYITYLKKKINEKLDERNS